MKHIAPNQWKASHVMACWSLKL